MTQEEIIGYLLKKKQIIQIGNQFYPLNKKLVIKAIKCKNYPDKFNDLTLDGIYSLFIKDCKLPAKESGKFVYLLRTKTKESIQILEKEILQNPEIDYTFLTESISRYYKDPKTTKYPMDKFLSLGLWRSFTDNSEESEEYVDKM